MRRLLVPAWHYRACAIVERVWGWSPAEEAVLLELFRSPGSTEDVARTLSLPRQVVVAAFERLMRHGLLDLELGEQPAFMVNAAGAACVRGGRALPERSEQRELGISLVYERLGHSVLRHRHVRGRWRNVNAAISDAHMIPLPPNEPSETYDTMEPRAWMLVRQSLRTGEVERAIRTTGSRIVRGFLEIDLDEARAGILPEGASERLRLRVIDALKTGKLPQLKRYPRDGVEATVETTFHPSQFVLGGQAQLERAIAIIDSSREDVFVLSTFVAKQDDLIERKRREELWSAFDRAAARGVRCHLFYGSSDEQSVKHAGAIEELSMRLRRHAHSSENILVYHQSVRSHAKMLAADDGAGGAVVLLGSCNWLQSPFRAFELSVELRAGAAAALGLDLFATVLSGSPEATRSIDGLRALAGAVRRWRPSAFAIRSRVLGEVCARMRVVHAHEHEPLLRRVAHGGHHRVMVATHRLGAPMVPAVFNPLRASKVDVGSHHVLYSRVAGPTKKRHVREQQERNVGRPTTLALKDPELHAKFLLWGDDDVVVTSMNWGSQQGDANAPHDELGIHITAPGAASVLLDQLPSYLPELRDV